MSYSVTLGVMTWETERIEANSAEEALKIANDRADSGDWDGRQTNGVRVECEDSVFNLETGKTEIFAEGDKRILDGFDNTRQIALVWDIKDVKFERPHLTDEQAMDVLEKIRDKHDADMGVSWQTLRDMADILYPKEGE